MGGLIKQFVDESKKVLLIILNKPGKNISGLAKYHESRALIVFLKTYFSMSTSPQNRINISYWNLDSLIFHSSLV